jgi:polyphosphate glucokinase
MTARKAENGAANSKHTASDRRSDGMRSRRSAPPPRRANSSSVPELRTLAIDVGGTALKAAVLDRNGAAIAPAVRCSTPQPCSPDALLRALADLVTPLLGFERVSVGFPGVVRDGRVLTAPHLGGEIWKKFPLAAALQRMWRKPVRVSNDAEVHGLGIVSGRGLELVATLGIGVGTSLFRDGYPTPHLELAHHPLRGGRTYDEYLGLAALRRIGVRQWNARLRWTVDVLYNLVRFDTLYLGGGNSANVEANLAANIRLVGNVAGLIGGIRLWDAESAFGANRFDGAHLGIEERGRHPIDSPMTTIGSTIIECQCGCEVARGMP